MATAVRPGEVELTHPDKVLFGDAGVTKADLAAYYARVAPLMLPHLRGRPLSFQVFPRGVGRPGHFLKQAPDYFPDWVPRVTVPKKGGTVDHVVADTGATLVLLANHNAVTPHAVTSRLPHLDRPDRLVIDLDPHGDEQFALVRGAARLVGELMRECGLEPFAMTTGSRGIHVVAPIAPEVGFGEALDLARAIAAAAVAASPAVLTTRFLKRERGERIFVDVLRNRWAQTSVPPYAVRARPEAPVAVPLRWDELRSSRLAPRRWTVRNVARRLGRVEDPWAGIEAAATSPRQAAKRAAGL